MVELSVQNLKIYKISNYYIHGRSSLLGFFEHTQKVCSKPVINTFLDNFKITCFENTLLLILKIQRNPHKYKKYMHYIIICIKLKLSDVVLAFIPMLKQHNYYLDLILFSKRVIMFFANQ